MALNLSAARLASAISDAALGQIIGSEFDSYLITCKDSNVIFTHLA